MTYFLFAVMVLIALRFFMTNRFLFTVGMKEAFSIYKVKSRAEINKDALLGGLFLMLSILTAYLENIFV